MKAFQLHYEVEGFEGSDCSATIIEADQSAAIRRLKNVLASRGQKVTHIKGTIVTVENVHATKEQEREALKEIRYLVESMGEGSYLSMAFEGCLEDAERNIEEDAGYSMKCRYLTAQKDAEYFKRAAENFSADSEKYQSELSSIRQKMLSDQDLLMFNTLLTKEIVSISNNIGIAAQDIVELADDPNTDEFRKAVQTHRSARQRQEEYSKLQERLNKVLSDRT